MTADVEMLFVPVDLMNAEIIAKTINWEKYMWRSILAPANSPIEQRDQGCDIWLQEVITG